MEKERRIKVLSVVALVIAVLGLTVAFAALSETLTINGTASVESASWDVHFESIKLAAQYGDASVSGEPVLNNITISGINMTITKPKDMIAYTFNIKNSGSINAKISSVEVGKLCTLESTVESCDWNNDGEVTEEDINKVNENISFVMAYGNKDTFGNTLKVGDTINVGETKEVSFIFVYEKYNEVDGIYGTEGSTFEATELPKRDLQFNDLSITINYVQAD